MACACHSHSWDVCEPRWASQPNQCIFNMFFQTPNSQKSSQDKTQTKIPCKKEKSAVVSTSLTLTLGNCRSPNLLSRLLSTKPIPVKRWRKYEVQTQWCCMQVVLWRTVEEACFFIQKGCLKDQLLTYSCMIFDSCGFLDDLYVLQFFFKMFG